MYVELFLADICCTGGHIAFVLVFVTHDAQEQFAEMTTCDLRDLSRDLSLSPDWFNNWLFRQYPIGIWLVTAIVAPFFKHSIKSKHINMYSYWRFLLSILVSDQ